MDRHCGRPRGRLKHVCGDQQQPAATWSTAAGINPKLTLPASVRNTLRRSPCNRRLDKRARLIFPEIRTCGTMQTYHAPMLLELRLRIERRRNGTGRFRPQGVVPLGARLCRFQAHPNTSSTTSTAVMRASHSAFRGTTWCRVPPGWGYEGARSYAVRQQQTFVVLWRYRSLLDLVIVGANQEGRWLRARVHVNGKRQAWMP